MTLRRDLIGAALGIVPPAAIRRAAGQYLGGTTVDDAIRCASALALRGLDVTLSVLGEAAATTDQVAAAATENRAVIDALARPGAVQGVHLGVKLTALGLEFDAALAASHLVALAEACERAGVVVEVDMEQAAHVDRVLSIVHTVRGRFTGVQAVLQAELYRSLADARSLVATGIPARIVKGAYKEGPTVAYQLPEVIRENYLALVKMFLEAGVPVGIGTHDEYLVYRSLQLADDLRAEPEDYEFQMIMGVQEQLRSSLLAQGQSVRVTACFGVEAHRWAIRRLQENPELIRHGLATVAARFPRARS